MVRSRTAKRPSDRRVARTDSALRAALLELIAKQDFETITVADIVNRAQISRATFYLHYTDREDLLLSVLEDSVVEAARLAAECCPANFTLTETAPPEPLFMLFRHFSDNAVLYREALGPDGSARLLHRMWDLVIRRMQEQFAAAGGDDGRGLRARAAFLSGALLGVVSDWLSSEDPRSEQEMAAQVWTLLIAQPPAR